VLAPGSTNTRKILEAAALSILSTAPRQGDLLRVFKKASMHVDFHLSDDRIIRVRYGSKYELTGMEDALVVWSGQGEEFLVDSMTSVQFKTTADWVQSTGGAVACSAAHDIKVE
jgi:hypothetical protein